MENLTSLATTITRLSWKEMRYFAEELSHGLKACGDDSALDKWVDIAEITQAWAEGQLDDVSKQPDAPHSGIGVE